MTDDLLAELVATLRGRPALTARELARAMHKAGHRVDKSTINAIVYRQSDLFRNDGAIPPRWSLASSLVPEETRWPYRVSGLMLENWKSFDGAEISFGGVTLLYGENSSGKSSLFQALSVMKESWGQGDLQLGPFGWYEHVVHGHDLDRDVLLGASWLDTTTAESWQVALLVTAGPQSLTFNEVHPVAALVLISPRGRLVLGREDPDEDEWGGQWIPTHGTQSEAASVVTMGSSETGFPDPDVWMHHLQSDVSRSEVDHAVREALDGGAKLVETMEFLPPMRLVPPRNIPMSWAQEHAGYLVALFEDRDELQLEVNEWLHRFEIPYTVSISRYGADGEGEQFELDLLRQGESGERVQLCDVGFGVSQLLPIIVELLSNRERTIFIEEPEAHVHPRLQSVLGDLFVTSNQDYGNVVIVETHSEPLLLRLQRRVAEGRIGANEVQVLHVVRDGPASEVHVAPILHTGQLDYQWPGGFFDNRMDDLIAIFDPQ